MKRRRNVYFETVRDGLVPVHEPVAEGNGPFAMCVAVVRRDFAGYHKGEEIRTHRRYFVHKAGFRDGFQLVSQWSPQS